MITLKRKPKYRPDYRRIKELETALDLPPTVTEDDLLKLQFTEPIGKLAAADAVIKNLYNVGRIEESIQAISEPGYSKVWDGDEWIEVKER